MKYLKSRTVWTIVILFVINGIGGVRDLLPPVYLTAIDGVLSIAAIYFRISPKQDFSE